MNFNWLTYILEKEEEPMTDKQKAIVKAAAELFSEKGYAATSTREIAQKADVSEGTIFKQFPTKKDLMFWLTGKIISDVLFPIMSRGLDELLAKDYKTRKDFLFAFLENRIGLLKEGIPLFRIVLQEVPFQPEIRSMLFEQVKKMPSHEIIKKMRLGEDSDFSEEEVTQLLVSCFLGFFFLHNIAMPEMFSKGRYKKDTVTLVHFIIRGLYKGDESQ